MSTISEVPTAGAAAPTPTPNPGLVFQLASTSFTPPNTGTAIPADTWPCKNMDDIVFALVMGFFHSYLIRDGKHYPSWYIPFRHIYAMWSSVITISYFGGFYALLRYFKGCYVAFGGAYTEYRVLAEKCMPNTRIYRQFDCYHRNYYVTSAMHVGNTFQVIHGDNTYTYVAERSATTSKIVAVSCKKGETALFTMTPVTVGSFPKLHSTYIRLAIFPTAFLQEGLEVRRMLLTLATFNGFYESVTGPPDTPEP